MAWLYAIVGVASYYIGTIFGGAILGIIIGFTNPALIETLSEWTLTFMMIPFGIISCLGLYAIFKNNWKKQAAREEADRARISDIGKRDDDDEPRDNFLIGNNDLSDLLKDKNK